MFKILQKFRLSLYRLFHIRRLKKTTAISQVANSVKKILFCLPRDSQGVQSIIASIDQFKALFPQAEYTMFNPSEHTLKENLNHGIFLVEHQNQIMDIFGRIKPQIKKEIQKQSFQLAIDFSKSYNPVNTDIVCLSNADICIGFYHPNRNPFYNFVIRVSNEKDWNQSLQIMYSYLKSM